MAKYQHRYRGASAADVMLAVDSTREEYEEIKAYEEYLKKLREQNKKKRRGGLFGSILGAVIGFATGGVSAALIGSTVGGAAATLPMTFDYYDRNKRYLNRDIWKGGKFNATSMRDAKDTLWEQNKDAKSADLIGIALDAITTGIGVKSAGGLMSKADKVAWKAMPLGERLTKAFGKDALVKDQLKAQTVVDAENVLKGGMSVTDLVSNQSALLDPKNALGGSFRPFQGGFARTLLDISGQAMNPNSAIGQLTRLMTQQQALRQGDTDLASYLMANQTFGKSGLFKPKQ